MARNDDLALAIWALHVAIRDRDVDPVLEPVRLAISGAARRLFPRQHNALRMRGYYQKLTPEQRRARIARQRQHNERWNAKRPDHHKQKTAEGWARWRERHPTYKWKDPRPRLSPEELHVARVEAGRRSGEVRRLRSASSKA